MAAAAITFDQAANPIPVGQPGRAREDLVLGQPVTARNADDTGVTRWRWTLRDRPLGSAAALSSTTAAAVTFTPDVPGSYLLALSVNDGLVGEIDPGRVAGVRDGFGRLYPATPQDKDASNWLVGGVPNTDGWGKEVERILRAIGVPQLLNSAQADGVPAGFASEHVIVGAIGLPDSASLITGYDWIDLQGGANVGPPPTVNGVVLTEVVGDAGLAAICVGDWDLDTTGTSVGDVWAFVAITDVSNLLLSRVTLT